MVVVEIEEDFDFLLDAILIGEDHVIVFGDLDGVIIVPKEAEEEAFNLAIEKARGEKLVKQALEEGMSTVEAFAKFGIM